jgi:hypothetical protein
MYIASVTELSERGESMDGTVLVDGQGMERHVASLGMQCDAREIPIPSDGGTPVGWWLAPYRFEGHAQPGGETGVLADAVSYSRDGLGAIAVCEDRVIGIMGGAVGDAAAAVWWSWPRAAISVSTPGVPEGGAQTPDRIQLDYRGGSGSGGATVVLRDIARHYFEFADGRAVSGSGRFETVQAASLLRALSRPATVEPSPPRSAQTSASAPPAPPPPAPAPQQPAPISPRSSQGAGQIARDSLARFSREELILGALGAALAIDLLFLPWFEFGVEGSSFSASSSATQYPDGWLGVIALLAVLALIADLVVERLAPHVQVPSIAGGRAGTRFAIALIAAAGVILKFLFHVHFSIFGAGFWLGALLTGGLVFFAAKLRPLDA